MFRADQQDDDCQDPRPVLKGGLQLLAAIEVA
jgi:hypothetical protein